MRFSLYLCVLLTLPLGCKDEKTEKRDPPRERVVASHVADNIYILTGPGGNVAASVGPDGILLVDDKFARLSGAIEKALATISETDLVYVVNTHHHADHVGGNTAFGVRSTIVAHDNARTRLVRKARNKAALPTLTFDRDLAIHFNGERVELIHLPGGHTDGDIAIFFRGANVIHLGDTFVNGRFPHIDENAGGDPLSEELKEAARLLQVDIGELYAASEILGGEEFEQSDDPEIRGAYERILMLNVAQKAVLAMRGGREERMILVRDTNKLVALGVLRNPRMTEDDVESIARMRNVSDEVLRQLGQNREWTKSYAIISTLVNNPRTPQGISTNFVPRLQTQDLKRLSRSRDVPELIRRMAKRTLGVRMQQRTGSFKKR